MRIICQKISGDNNLKRSRVSLRKTTFIKRMGATTSANLQTSTSTNFVQIQFGKSYWNWNLLIGYHWSAWEVTVGGTDGEYYSARFSSFSRKFFSYLPPYHLYSQIISAIKSYGSPHVQNAILLIFQTYSHWECQSPENDRCCCLSIYRTYPSSQPMFLVKLHIVCQEYLFRQHV